MALTHLARAGLPVHSSRSATFLPPSALEGFTSLVLHRSARGGGGGRGGGGMQGVGRCHTGVVVRGGHSVTGTGECRDEGVISESDRSPW